MNYIFLRYHFSGNTSSFHYWDYLMNFWRNNWRSIIDVVEGLCLRHLYYDWKLKNRFHITDDYWLVVDGLKNFHILERSILTATIYILFTDWISELLTQVGKSPLIPRNTNLVKFRFSEKATTICRNIPLNLP